MTTKSSTNNLSARPLLVISQVVLLLLLAATPARAHWPNQNLTKWLQPPDPTNGIDVLVGQLTTSCQPIILADDFQCRRPGPISDIHIWTSWTNNQPSWNLPITLCIWSDVKAVTNAVGKFPSHPGTILWCQTFLPGQYTIQPWRTAFELFWNPNPQCPFFGSDKMIWLYNFYPTNAFIQQGSPTVACTYWLSMSVPQFGNGNRAPFGWKTASTHWNDDAVWAVTDITGTNIFPAGTNGWMELYDPRNTVNPRSLDLAFVLTMPQTTNAAGFGNATATNKWAEYPDPNGLDVNATVQDIVADDFQCNSAGLITNVQVWASWKSNRFDNAASFIVSIYDDVPAGSVSGAATNFSHPGHLLCSQTFPPNSYRFQPIGTAPNEQFYEPDTGQITPEQVVFLYSFDLKTPCCQKGSTNQPVTYWLSVNAQTTTGLQFGWKTSTNHWSDDSVYGHVSSSGGALGDWKELVVVDPLTGTAVSLDQAFIINSGPPDRNCDPNFFPKVVQWPDLSTNGLDVLATAPNIVGDDFLCQISNLISGITVWGSWLNDKVDTNATFTLGLWSDVPRNPGTTNFSHPGDLLCQSVFYPFTASGSVEHYTYQLDASNLFENFYDPNVPAAPPFLGTDTQIWRYNFYPRQISTCWIQKGLPTANRTYWLSLNYNVNPNSPGTLFGWKTSTNHWNDDAVWGHLGSGGVPLGDWKDLHDPRTGQSLDLSYALERFPVVGINKDLHNLSTTDTATGIQIVVAGIHEVTWHYDNGWPFFTYSWVAGNTVLTWTGATVPPLGVTHVGFEIAATSVTIVSMNWLPTTVTPKPYQYNYHSWNNGNLLTISHDLVGLTNTVTLASGSVEFHPGPVPLSLMLPGATRNPISVVTLTNIVRTNINPGCCLSVPLPPPPTGAQYALFLINLEDQQRQMATMDFMLLPLDIAITPTIKSINPSAGMISLVWPTVAGRMYKVQASTDLSIANSFFDVFFDLQGDGTDMSMEVPMMGNRTFYKVGLQAE